MTRYFIFRAWIILLAIIFSTVNCGQQESPSTTTTTLSPSQMITLSGSLSIGTIASGIKASSIAAGYKVMVIDNSSGQTFACIADSSGTF